MTPPRIAIATNNGDIGGGEVMLLNIATALRDLSIDVTVVGPRRPGELIEAAAMGGFKTVALPAHDRPSYMAALASWRLKNRSVPLWCNGLVPSTATAGMGPRLAHLHLVPTRAQQVLLPAARWGAARTVVPSAALAQQIPGSTVLHNWTEPLDFAPRTSEASGPLRIGFLGRHVRDKGLDVLLRALAHPVLQRGTGVRLVLAGEGRFGSPEDQHAIAEAARPVEGLIERIGWVQPQEFFDQVDLACFPSVERETFGLVAAEAMAAGTPFVISDHAALREVAGQTHPWVARMRDDEHLALVLRDALDALTDGTGQDAVRAARTRWENCFSPEAGARRTADLLIDLTRRPGPTAEKDNT